jgi:hypothetical protein
MKKLFLTLVTLVLSLAAAGNDWNAYMSYHNVTSNIPVGNKIYALAGGSLFSYTFGDSKVQTYSKFLGLSGANITNIAYCEEEQAFLLVYDDYNIDILGTNDSITNIPQYKNASFSDKTINDVTVMGHEAFLSTSFGVIVINLKKAEFTNVYELGTNVRTAIGDDDRIFARVADGILAGDRSDNLLDKSNWKTWSSTSKPLRFMNYNGGVYALYGDGLYGFDTETFKVRMVCKGVYSSYCPYGKNLVLQSTSKIGVVDEDEKAAITDISNDFASLSSDGTYLWASRKSKGLQPFTIDADTLKPASDPVIPNSPIRNYFSDIQYTDYNKLLVAGGALSYYGKTYYEGTVMSYQDGLWTNFSEDSISKKTGTPYINITSVAEDPNDRNHHFASSADGGLYEYRNGVFQKLYNCDNSPISSIYPNNANLRLRYNRLTGAKYDAKGNLWMFNNLVDTVVRVLTPDMKWKSFYLESVKEYPTFDHYIFDSRGWVWMTHRRWAGTYSAGIACLNYNGTLDNKADDKFTFCTTFTNQNGTTTTISLLYNAVFDQNDQLWIATDQGVFVLEKPSNIFSSSVTFRQPLVPRNDGTNYADYLLEGVAVRTIVVDGANRKWIGTDNNGLYLVSEDGTEILEHFTMENSSLLSDCILSLAISPVDGLLMIGTDLGLVSYRADATPPAETLSESNIKVFPNPVRPEYEGKIRVTGFVKDSDVKITTATGMVVTQGTSLGGTFVWDGCDSQGKRVATGVYYVVGSDSEGKNGVVAKVLVVK